MAQQTFAAGGPSFPNNSIAVIWDDGVFFIFLMTDATTNPPTTLTGGFYHYNFLAGSISAASGGSQQITEAGPDTSSSIETIKFAHRNPQSASSPVFIVIYDDTTQVMFTNNIVSPPQTFTAQLIYAVAG